MYLFSAPSPRGYLSWIATLTLSVALVCQVPISRAEVGPAEVIEDVTARIMAVVAAADEYFDTDEERYYREIDAVLSDLVDWRGFAKGVMGEYASGARYRSLDEAGQQALRAQLDRFTTVLQEGLIRSYAKGLLAFGGANMEVQGAEASPESARVASVTQLVYGEGERVYTIRYQMGQYKDGSWRLRNLVIESINLGEIYRNQFDALVTSADGDIDLAIDRWGEALEQRDEEIERD
jgi:phospholipid transport system substrate-binding protein